MKRLLHVSLFMRIAVGNALVISVGAVFGTLLTRHFSGTLEGWFIVLFASSGILLSLLINFLILDAALHPLRELRRWADKIAHGDSLQLERLKNPDADTVSLAGALHTLVNQLDERNHELKALSERAIFAQEQERKSIARSLHDDTGQALTMLIISLDQLETRLPANQQALKEDIRQARSLAANALTELRGIVFGLRPAILDDLGLVPAMRWYARSQLDEAGLQVDVQSPDPMPDLPAEISISLFRITQEAINNVLRHADASKVEIEISLQAGSITLQVRDDGKGFDPQHASQSALPDQRLGLLGVRERAELLDGQLDLLSSPGQGTCLTVRLPLSSTIQNNEKDPHPAG
jgi:two-component system sensor histidine kinase UhpB